MDIQSYLLGKKAGGGGSGDLDWTAIGYEAIPQYMVNDYNYSKNIFDNWDASQTDLKDKYKNNKNLVYMPLVDTSNAIKASSMFSGCTNLENVPLLDTSNMTNIQSMFATCNKLKTIPLFNTGKATNLGQMFDGCLQLTSVPLFDMKKAENTSQMFYNCQALKDVPVFNLASATAMNNMFNGCYVLTDESLDNILQMCIGATSYTGTKTLQTIGLRSSYHPASKIQALPHYQAFINAGWTIGY